MKNLFKVIVFLLFLVISSSFLSKPVFANTLYSNTFTSNADNWIFNYTPTIDQNGITNGLFGLYQTQLTTSTGVLCASSDTKFVSIDSNLDGFFMLSLDQDGSLLDFLTMNNVGNALAINPALSGNYNIQYEYNSGGLILPIDTGVAIPTDGQYHTYTICEDGKDVTLYLDNNKVYQGAQLISGGPTQYVGIGIISAVDYSTGGFLTQNYVKNYSVTDTLPTPPANQPPSISPLTSTPINEGEVYSTTGSFSDPDSSSWIATVDYGDGSGVQALPLSGQNFTLSHAYKDEGTYTVTVSVIDSQGATGTTTANITVNNSPFTVSAISAPTSSVAINTANTFSATFSDPGILDTHTATWNWGDGSTSSGTVTENNGSGTISDSHTYTAAGVYTVTLTVTDDDGLTETSTYQYVVAYDPSAGFLTGTGVYYSQAGWDMQNSTASGNVNFGISAKYTSTSTTPTGQTMLNFKIGNLAFKADSYAWLVVNGAKAMLQGTGMVNGTGSYTFLISGIDGSQTGGQNLIRVKITDNSSNTVIYDTQPGAADTADPITPLARGSIKIH